MVFHKLNNRLGFINSFRKPKPPVSECNGDHPWPSGGESGRFAQLVRSHSGKILEAKKLQQQNTEEGSKNLGYFLETA